ncbi:MAG: cytochrome c oxidase accessory protein CcoG [Albidovulum sp.]|nr:cytochrome c oxidase accessory protein CcoG [Albidovulum sp.]MDE0531592.1 cytochrome c oxidase accessory protein CcoG [Albidovulum sp.]
MNAGSTPSQSLFAPRDPVFPRRVSGRFRTLKWWMLGITLGIYYATPWIRWDRGPNLPDQAVLIDLAGRRFFFFWIEIWPHEFYFVAWLLIMAGVGLFLFTSVLGRVWCGYACPQTIWTDLFILIERAIEGDRNKRVRLWNAPMSVRKLRVRTAKWTAWLAISVCTGGAWVFYFADAPTLFIALVTFSAHPIAYASVGILTATTFVLGGFMREQVCIYMCPWPRIQAAMMDENSITVAYRPWRGEPRGKHRKAKGSENLGDCIDCEACVNVCPMGIDIRNGHQLECISCALCIDACDDVMNRIGKPRGLVDYLSLNDERLKATSSSLGSLAKQVLRPRVLLYSAIWSGIGVALVVALFTRPDIEFSVAAVRNPINVLLSDNSIRNSYVFRIRNRQNESRSFRISLSSTEDFDLMVAGSSESVATINADETAQVRIHVTTDPGSPAARRDNTSLRFWVEDALSGERAAADSVFRGRP